MLEVESRYLVGIWDVSLFSTLDYLGNVVEECWETSRFTEIIHGL